MAALHITTTNTIKVHKLIVAYLLDMANKFFKLNSGIKPTYNIRGVFKAIRRATTSVIDGL
jgi:hypothetical protein